MVSVPPLSKSSSSPIRSLSCTFGCGRIINPVPLQLLQCIVQCALCGSLHCHIIHVSSRQWKFSSFADASGLCSIENEYHVIELERTSALNARVRLATYRIERTFARFNGPAVHVGGVCGGVQHPHIRKSLNWTQGRCEAERGSSLVLDLKLTGILQIPTTPPATFLCHRLSALPL